MPLVSTKRRPAGGYSIWTHRFRVLNSGTELMVGELTFSFENKFGTLDTQTIPIEQPIESGLSTFVDVRTVAPPLWDKPKAGVADAKWEWIDGGQVRASGGVPIARDAFDPAAETPEVIAVENPPPGKPPLHSDEQISVALLRIVPQANGGYMYILSVQLNEEAYQNKELQFSFELWHGAKALKSETKTINEGLGTLVEIFDGPPPATVDKKGVDKIWWAAKRLGLKLDNGTISAIPYLDEADIPK